MTKTISEEEFLSGPIYRAEIAEIPFSKNGAYIDLLLKDKIVFVGEAAVMSPRELQLVIGFGRKCLLDFQMSFAAIGIPEQIKVGDLPYWEAQRILRASIIQPPNRADVAGRKRTSMVAGPEK